MALKLWTETLIVMLIAVMLVIWVVQQKRETFVADNKAATQCSSFLW
jgi:hypothetical protein